MNGSVMPLVGIRCSVEAMLTKACRPKLVTRPVAAEHDERVVLGEQAQQAAQHDEGEHAEDDQADDQAEFLAGDGEDEVGMGVRQDVLDAALARAAAEQAAIAEGLQRRRRPDSCRRCVGMQEALHAAVHMREERRRRRQPAPPMPPSADADQDDSSARRR